MKLLEIIRLLPLKILIKKRRFLRNAKCGINLSVSAYSNCICEDGGEIIIGNNCDIHSIISCKKDACIKIGNYTTIRYGTIVGCCDRITIGDHVIISNNVHIYDNNNHPISPFKRIKMCESGFYSQLWDWKYSSHKPIFIDNNVWIGERSTILKGVHIGEGSIVASNSVVTKNVPRFTIVAGNPAQVVKHISNDNKNEI